MAIKDCVYDREVIEKADRLWVGQMTLRDVAEILDVPWGTVRHWSNRGWLTKENPYDYERGPQADNETVREVERKLQIKPARRVSEETGVPRTTIQSWINRGWVICEVDWKEESPKRQSYKVNPRLVIEYYYARDERTYKDAADEFDINYKTVKKYLRKYKNGNL
jgi:DNA-directed RNA polymerase specialized sigma24 family protein